MSNRMTCITWNVRRSNASVFRLIDYALSFQPDVVCLQEVPEHAMAYLHTTGYTVTSVPDFSSEQKQNNSYICTLTLQKPIRTRTITYSDITSTSLLNRLAYVRMSHAVEQHRAPAVTLRIHNTPIQIVNARLSCAVGPIARLSQFETMWQNTDTDILAVFCGDFNIIGSVLFRIFTGWVRGFTVSEYRLNERQHFDASIAKKHLINIFRRTPTIFASLPAFQLDHILVPDSMRVLSHTIGKNRFGSDHRMLYAHITLR